VKAIANNIRLSYNENDIPEVIVTLKGSRQQMQKDINDLKKIIDNNKELSVEIKQNRKARSLDSNAYLWVLCSKIADAVSCTKEDIYKSMIRNVGQFEIVPIKNEAVDRWIECWNSKGIGWFAEILHESKIEGYTNIISYYGSSIYSTSEMSRLIEEVVYDCKKLDIETITPEELERLNKEWR